MISCLNKTAEHTRNNRIQTGFNVLNSRITNNLLNKTAVIIKKSMAAIIIIPYANRPGTGIKTAKDTVIYKKNEFRFNGFLLK